MSPAVFETYLYCNLLVVYMKFKLNQASCILFGSFRLGSFPE